MALVVDASALLYATTDPSRSARALLGRLQDETTHAPHLVDAEVGAAVRRKVLRGEMPEDRAVSLLSTYAVLIDHRHEHHGPLTALAWGLRANLSFYDALYVCLGAVLDAEVVTLDAGIARAPNLPARITLANA